MTRSPIAVSFMVLVALAGSACSDSEPVLPNIEPPAEARGGAAGKAAIHPVGEVEPVVSFDLSAGEAPEGVALDKVGNLFVTLAPLGQVLRIAPDGTRSVLAVPDPAPSGPGALGLATDPKGNVYLALSSANPSTHGVHVIRSDGSSMRLPGSEAIGFPNDLAIDKHGNLYVTDSSGGAIWRIPRGGTAEVWISDPLLEGNGAFGLGIPIGANGVAIHGDVVWVSNSEEALLVRILVEKDGSAGDPEVVAGGPALFGLDGIALDVHGRVYGALNVQNRVVRFDPTSGSMTILADASDGLDFPAALAFGTGRGLRKTVFIANFALLDDPANPTPPGPGVVKLEVGAPGLPTP